MGKARRGRGRRPSPTPLPQNGLRMCEFRIDRYIINPPLSPVSCQLIYLTVSPSQVALMEGIILIIVFGIFAALVADLFSWIRREFYKDKENVDTSFDAGGNVSIGLTATTIVSQWTWAATLLQSSNVGTKVSEGMQSLHSNVHSIKFYVWYNRSSNISRRNISCFLKLYISPGERTNHGPPVHGQPKWITQIDYP